jgi:glycosyltransferase involved in cell wall biosynthesis
LKKAVKSIATNQTLPLVSIVLATYNGEKYLEEQLNSLFGQSYPNLEIIAVDDRSSDNTVSILNEYATRHNNMKVHVNEVNLGFIKNFEKGCTLTNGELIALCDQDDYWHKDRIKNMAAAIGSHPMIYCNSLVCKSNLEPTGKKISDLVNFKTWTNCLQLAVFCRIYAHATLFKRSFFQQAYPFLDIVPPDWWLPYLATLNGGLKYHPEALIQYRQHEGNVTGVIGGRSKKQRNVDKAERKRREIQKIRARVKAFYDACPAEMLEEKKVLQKLVECYQDFSLKNNFKRLLLFLRYRDTFLAVKKHSALHRFLFCFKMLVKIK